MQVWGGVNKPNPTGQKGIFQINLNAEFSSMLGEGGGSSRIIIHMFYPSPQNALTLSEQGVGHKCIP